MTDGAAVDTDVLLKTAAYRLADEVFAVLEPRGRPAVLGLTHLIAGKQLARKRAVRDKAGAATELDRLLAMLGCLEPDEAEIALAAELAAIAQDRELPLDAGEAQLVAILMRRGLPVLVTGDKRAIGALARLAQGSPIRVALFRRLACFEQLIESVVHLTGELELRARICAEPDVDGAMRLACSCGQDEWGPGQLREACESYSGELRGRVGDVIVEGLLLT